MAEEFVDLHGPRLETTPAPNIVFDDTELNVSSVNQTPADGEPEYLSSEVRIDTEAQFIEEENYSSGVKSNN